MYTVEYDGNYTTSYYSYSLGTVSEDTAYSVSLVYGYKTHTGANPVTAGAVYYVDVYTIQGMEKQPESTPTPVPTNLIIFTVQVYVDESTTRSYSFTGESGMTWTQFISSTYNVNSHFTSYTQQGLNIVQVYNLGVSGRQTLRLSSFSGTSVKVTDTLIANNTYYAKS